MGNDFNLAARIAKEDRVRAHTPPELNHRIDAELNRRIRFYATQKKETISGRLEELDREWDTERILETNAAGLVLLSMVFGVTRGRKWFLLPVVVSGFLLQHALTGWCPPVALLRRLGVRTRIEIEQERYALKFLRGDFDLEREEGGRLREPGELVKAVHDDD
jgi:hypothetical protein